MGIIFMWLQGNDVAELEKEKQKRLEKIEMLKAEIKAIDEKIVELNSKK